MWVRRGLVLGLEFMTCKTKGIWERYDFVRAYECALPENIVGTWGISYDTAITNIGHVLKMKCNEMNESWRYRKKAKVIPVTP